MKWMEVDVRFNETRLKASLEPVAATHLGAIFLSVDEMINSSHQILLYLIFAVRDESKLCGRYYMFTEMMNVYGYQT